jgi:hypothetical protein
MQEMTWSGLSEIILAVAVETAASPAAAAEPVIIAPAVIHGELSDAVGERLEASLHEAVRRSNIEVVKTSDELGRRTAACADASCRAELITKGRAEFLLIPDLTLDDKDYQLRVTLYAASRADIARLEETCTLCGLAEALDLMTDLGARMGRKVDLAARAAFVAIRSQPPGARVLIAGELVGTTPLELPLDPGIHQLHIEHAGYIDLTRRVEVVAGETSELDLELQRVPTKPPDHRKRFAALGGVSLVTGIAGIAGGAVMLGIEEQPTLGCSGADLDVDGNCRWRYATREAGVGFVIGGAALIGTGIALLVVGRKKFKASAAARMRPTWEGFVLEF